ncbi:chorismate mutase aro7 [Chytridiales sp. JEL 0842]|nr:chorismate mutase aro7 [Chytridiales sp. JEL 0842]
MNFTQEPLSLSRIRDELVKLEDTIIFAQNAVIYEEGKFDFKDSNRSFLDFFMFEIESAHAKVRRYTSPDEYPFSSSLPAPILPPLKFPKILAPNDINLNEKLKKIYIQNIVPNLCRPGDDGNYGSAATKDTEALQILSRRIHFGKFVAEAKFQSVNEHEKYVELIKKGDRVGIEELLTNRAVEERLLRRLRKKAWVYGQEIEDDMVPGGSRPTSAAKSLKLTEDKDPQLRIPVDSVANMYEQFVIPLTKEVEVEYLLRRLDHPDFTPEIRQQ